MKSSPFAGHAAAFVTTLIWGTTFISTKVLLRVFTPSEILLLRFAIGYFALWCAFPHPLAIKDRRQELCFLAAGLCGVTLYYLFENMALTYTLASNVGVIISIAPFFTAIFSCLFLRAPRPGARFFLGFLIAMAGIALIHFGKGGALRLGPLGDLLAIIAAVIWAAYSTLTKRISTFGCNTIQATRRTFFYGLLLMLPALYFMGFEVSLSELCEPAVLLNILFLGLGASALCFVTWNFAVKILGCVKTSAYIYMVPVVTAATSALVLHEEITLRMVCGIVLTLAGLFLSENKGAKKECERVGTAK